MLAKLKRFAGIPAIAVWVLTLSGCAPAVASHCSAGNKSRTTTIVTLTNHSLKEIVSANVLVDTNAVHLPRRKGRLFRVATNLAPFQSQTVQTGPADNDSLYDFKFATNGCELDSVIFRDGTTWELGSPL